MRRYGNNYANYRARLLELGDALDQNVNAGDGALTAARASRWKRKHTRERGMRCQLT
jgi:hypothetical protein